MIPGATIRTETHREGINRTNMVEPNNFPENWGNIEKEWTVGNIVGISGRNSKFKYWIAESLGKLYRINTNDRTETSRLRNGQPVKFLAKKESTYSFRDQPTYTCSDVRLILNRNDYPKGKKTSLFSKNLNLYCAWSKDY